MRSTLGFGLQFLFALRFLLRFLPFRVEFLYHNPNFDFLLCDFCLLRSVWHFEVEGLSFSVRDSDFLKRRTGCCMVNLTLNLSLNLRFTRWMCSTVNRRSIEWCS